MKHAFLIIAHNEPGVLAALLQQLDDERNDIYLHIDARSAAMLGQFPAVPDFISCRSRMPCIGATSVR